MALTESQKVRLGVAVSHLRRESSWQTIHQFCVAEASQTEPDYTGLKEYVLNLVDKALTEDIEMGIRARQ